MRLIFLGPPGAGKGTLASLVCREQGIPQISTGDIFREAIKKGTPLGKKVKEILDRGDLVPDALTVDIVRERVGKPDAASGYVLDGFPRTIAQAEALQGFQKIDAVINFIAPDDVVIQRLSGRRICKSCGAIFHVRNMPPKKEGICDSCGGPLYTRPDDQEDSIRNRLQVYRAQTEPLVRYYKEKGLLHDVDSATTPEKTMTLVRKELQGLR